LTLQTLASYMSLNARATLDIGKYADIIVTNKDLDILELM